jgi:phage/plasmid-like protein (TIGR03299 family)
MAHELEFVNGEAAMAYRESKGKPWHDLGVPVGDDLTPIEMMKAAKLDWTVRKVDTYAKVEDLGEEPKFIKTGEQALIRESDGKVLTTVGSGWKPVQNIEAFEFFNDFVREGQMVMDTAGSLRDGRIVWALADLKEDFRVFGTDEMKGYLLFSNPHVYGKSIDVRFCLERVVCNNTLTMALSEGGRPSVKVNHRSHFDSNRVQEILGISQKNIETYKEKAEYLGTKHFKSDTLNKYFGHLFGETEDGELSRKAEEVMSYVENQPGKEYAAGTFYQMFNAVTYYIDNKSGRNVDNRFSSAWFGPNAKKKLDALDLALNMETV